MCVVFRLVSPQAARSAGFTSTIAAHAADAPASEDEIRPAQLYANLSQIVTQLDMVFSTLTLMEKRMQLQEDKMVRLEQAVRHQGE